MTKYRIIEDGYDLGAVDAESASAALALAVAAMDRGSYVSLETRWVDVIVNAEVQCPDHGLKHMETSGTWSWCSLWDEERGDGCEWQLACASDSGTVTIDPPEPVCIEIEGFRSEHDWQSPSSHPQNPGGVIVHEICTHCGVRRIRDTCATRNDTGEQGLKSVRYETADR